MAGLCSVTLRAGPNPSTQSTVLLRVSTNFFRPTCKIRPAHEGKVSTAAPPYFKHWWASIGPHDHTLQKTCPLG
eukprot:9469583-Pyramimonas_sp.AAC.1